MTKGICQPSHNFIGYLANISQFTQKVPFQARTTEAQFGPKLWNIMSHDSLSEDLLEVLWHDKTQ